MDNNPPQTKTCPMCNGTKRLKAVNEYHYQASDEQFVPCWTCSGKGTIPVRR